MKRNHLARRAASAALAACMMFTLSAPVLAESTDALMQLSISGNRAARVLDAENSTGDIKINNNVIDPTTYENIVVSTGNYTFHYDPVQKILTSTNARNIGAIIIEVPNDVDVVLGGDSHIAVNNLTIKGAHDVTISSDTMSAIGSKAEITCTGKVTIDAPEATFAIGATSSTSDGNLTISGASEVEINAPNSRRILGGFYSTANITCDGPVTIRGNADGGSTLAKSFTYNRTDGADYVYFTSEDGEEGAIDASVTPLVENGKYTYLRIEEKQDAHLKVNNGTVTVGDTASEELNSFKGQKVTVTSTVPETENRKFDGWEVTSDSTGFTISADKLKQKEFSFIMPAGAVELTAHHSNKLEVSGGTATVNGNEVNYARPDAAVSVTADDRSAEGYKFDHWVVSGGDIGKTGDELKANPLDFSMPDEAAKLTAVYRAAVKVSNGTAQTGTESGETVYALEGDTVTVTGHDSNASFSKFVKWEVVKAPAGFTLSDEQQNTETMTFTMPEGAVELKAIYSIPAITMDMPVIVTGGTINDGTENPLLVKPGEKVTVKADEKDEPVKFHHWVVEKGTSEDFGLTEGSLGSVTETGTEEISFIMPQGAVKLTAVYSTPAGVQKNYITVDGGIGIATINGSEDAKAELEIGSTVKVSAEVDQNDYPGMTFDHWEVVYPESFKNLPDAIRKELELDLDDSSTIEFAMPKYPVTLVAHWIDGTTPVEPGMDDPADPDFGVDDGSGAAGAIVVGAALGGAAVWGGYEITTRVILNDLLPEGAAIPANRGELAVLLWNTAGKPEPAAQPAFTDVADAELAKAAQWCVEQGLLDAKDGKFDPNGWMPKFKTIEVWKKAFPKQ